MLLVMDVGNTNTVLGVYEEDTLVAHWRLSTRKHQTADEYGILIKNLFLLNQMNPEAITAMILSSVVPPLVPTLEKMAQEYFHIFPLIVGPELDIGMPILYEHPSEVGADRIVNAVAAYAKYGGPLIVVDFGTATTFEAISKQGEYLGGAIVPGLGISTDALFQHAAKLPRIELTKPESISVIGKNTVHSMQAGIILGYAALVDGLIARMKAEMPEPPYVVATGGLVSVVADEVRLIDQIDHFLTLEGLKILFYRNQNRLSRPGAPSQISALS
ncbi:MAG: type III pantothenate kinase [Nitrospinota bacterium]|nr:MAG: type III pantothenate kinase [Nitrospinota bacterium]